jgi:hypothetical protein
VSRRAIAVLAVVVAVVVAAVIARVVSSDVDEKTASECAAAGVERPLPSGFPTSFPLPPGTRITQGARSAAGSFFVQGAAPLSAPEAVAFYRVELGRAGWRAAAAREREGAGVSAAFRGHGFTGTWTVDEVPGCTAAAFLTLRFRTA